MVFSLVRKARSSHAGLLRDGPSHGRTAESLAKQPFGRRLVICAGSEEIARHRRSYGCLQEFPFVQTAR